MDRYQYDVLFDLMELAWQAYYANETDAFFADGKAVNLAGVSQAYRTRNDWLTAKAFTLIQDPSGDPSWGDRVWGIVYEHSIDGNVVVAFRGTELQYQNASVYSWFTDSMWSSVCTYLGLACGRLPSDQTTKLLTILNDLAIDGLTGLQWSDFVDGLPRSAWNNRIFFPMVRTSFHRRAWVHAGFYGQYRELEETLIPEIVSRFRTNPALKNLYVTGHSLGGALATLFALGVRQAGQGGAESVVPPPRLVTFASPLVGNRAFAGMVDDCIREDSLRIENVADWVTTVPQDSYSPDWLEWWTDLGPNQEQLYVPPFARGTRTDPEPPTRVAAYEHVKQALSLGSGPATLLGVLDNHPLSVYYDLLRAEAGQAYSPHDPWEL